MAMPSILGLPFFLIEGTRNTLADAGLPPFLGAGDTALRWTVGTGTLPTEIGLCSLLETLHVAPRLADGPLPSELGQLSRLRVLDVAGNRLEGTLPSELGRLRALRTLQLQGNRLRGRVPEDLGRLPRLARCDLTAHLSLDVTNLFTGPLPHATCLAVPASHVSRVRWGDREAGSVEVELISPTPVVGKDGAPSPSTKPRMVRIWRALTEAYPLKQLKK